MKLWLKETIRVIETQQIGFPVRKSEITMNPVQNSAFQPGAVCHLLSSKGHIKNTK